MEIYLSEDAEFDYSSVEAAIGLNIPLKMVTYSLPVKTQDCMSSLLNEFLNKCDLSSCYNKLNYCLSEILFNAIKANIKHVFFKEKNLDINNQEDYETGMKTFREEISTNKDYYLQILKNKNLYVTFSLTIENNRFIMEVRNNTLMSNTEEKRVKEKFSDYLDFGTKSLDECVIDQSEGAGLGIRSVLLILKSFGQPDDNFQLFTKERETISRLIIDKPIIRKIS